MAVYRSGEDYLEAIWKLGLTHGQVRSVDVAAELGFSKPSVSVAMKKLRQSGHVEMDDQGLLTLTDQGREVAQHIYERHQVLTQLLLSLGVDRETAAQEACALEHDLSDGTFEKIKAHFVAGLETPEG